MNQEKKRSAFAGPSQFFRDLIICAALSGIPCLFVRFFARRYPTSVDIVLLCFWLLLSTVSMIGLTRLRSEGLPSTAQPGSEDLIFARQRMQEIQLQRRKEQLNALQCQINPHFLYNTLDTIRGMALEYNDVEVAKIVGVLSAMFKYSMDYSNSIVTVGEELTHLQSYLKIQSTRFPDRFTFETIWEGDYHQIYQARIPKLVLQPIVENIFTHGFKGMYPGGQIVVRLISDNQKIQIIISDNGAGISDNEVIAINRAFAESVHTESQKPDFTGEGIALKNIDLRVKMSFGDKYGLHIASTLGYGTDVTVALPAENFPA